MSTGRPKKGVDTGKGLKGEVLLGGLWQGTPSGSVSTSRGVMDGNGGTGVSSIRPPCREYQEGLGRPILVGRRARRGTEEVGSGSQCTT